MAKVAISASWNLYILSVNCHFGQPGFYGLVAICGNFGRSLYSFCFKNELVSIP